MSQSIKPRLLATSAIAAFAVQGFASAAQAQDAFGIHVDTPEREVVAVESGETVQGDDIGVYADNGPVDLTVEENGEVRGNGQSAGDANSRPSGGVVIAQADSSVTNSGLISGGAHGVTTTYFFSEDANGDALAPQALTANTVVKNTETGSIIGEGGHGVAIIGGGSVSNDGLIRGTGTGNSTGVVMAGYPDRIDEGVTGIGSVTNGADGIIEGGVFGVLLSGGGTIENDGVIRSLNQQAAPGTSPFGVIMSAVEGQEGREATLVNNGSVSGFLGVLVQGTLAEATVSNSGTIAGQAAGMFLNAAEGTTTVNNLEGGIVSGGAYAIRANSGEIVVNNEQNASISSGVNAIEVWAPGTTINNAGSIEGGQYGIVTLNQQGSPLAVGTQVDNSGTIIGQNNDGVRLAGGGRVTNSGSIAGVNGGQSDGVSMFAFATQANEDFSAEVINGEQGSIYGFRYGVILSGGGEIQNAGQVHGVVGGVFIQGIASNSEAGEDRSGLSASVTNSGSILGEQASGVGFGSDLATAFLENSGYIVGSNAEGVLQGSTGDATVLNSADGVIEGATSGIIADSDGTLTVDNAGTIRGNGTYDGFDQLPAAGITIATRDSVVVNSGTISGSGAGITTAATYDPFQQAYVGNAIGTSITNSGTIEGESNDGVRLIGGGAVVNRGTISGRGMQYADGVSMYRHGDQAFDGYVANVSNTAGGTIDGERMGIILSSGGSVDNAGTITGDLSGVQIQSQGSDTGQTAQVTNTGTIAGAADAGLVFAGDIDSASLDNAGSISGLLSGLVVDIRGTTSILNSGTIDGGEGPAIWVSDISGSVTLDNAGVLDGDVILSTGGDTVTLRSGSAITGTLDAGGGTDSLTLAGDVLELTEAQVVGSADNFESLVVTSGYWSTDGTVGAFDSVAVGQGASLQVNETLVEGELDSPIFTSAVVVDGNLVLNFSEDEVVSGLDDLSISGSGGLQLVGDAIFTVDTDMLTYTGGTTISDGGLILTGTLSGDVTTEGEGSFTLGAGGTEGSFDGDIVNNGTFNFNRSDDYDFFGAFSGNGTLNKYGAGTLTFEGDYAFDGMTNIYAGQVRIGGIIDPETDFNLGDGGSLDITGNDQAIGGLSGEEEAVVELGEQTLTIDQEENTEFAGAIEGDGSIVKDGDGILNLTGDSTYTGDTFVNGGTLAVNGTIISEVIVNAGGTLGGNGTVGDTTIGDDGILGPGNSIGRLTVAGDLVFAAGSTYEVEVNSAGQADRVDATGQVTISSTASVAVMAEDGDYAPRTDYIIVTGEDGVSGTFGSVTTDLAFLDPFLRYGSNQVTLSLYRNDIDFADVAADANQGGVATAIQALGIDNPLFETVLVQNAAAAQASFADLSGEILSSTVTGLTDDSRHLRNALMGMEAPAEAGVFAWGAGFGGWSDFDNGLGLESDHLGFVAGVGYGSQGFAVAVSGGLGSSNLEQAGRGDTAEADSTFLAAHGTFGGELGFNGTVGVSYAWHDIATSRSVTVPTLAQTLLSSRDADTLQIFGELGYGLAFGSALVTPFARVAHVSTESDAFSEAGGSGALSMADLEQNTTLLSLGARAGLAAADATFRPYLSAAWNRAFGDRSAVASARFVSGGPQFDIAGVAVPRDSAEIEAGFEYGLGALTVGAAYSGVVGGSRDAHGARLTLRYTF